MADLNTQIRDYFEATAPAVETHQVARAPAQPDRAPRLVPGWVVAIGSAVVVGLAIGIPALFLLSGDGGVVATRLSVSSTITPPTTVAAATPSPVSVPVVEGGAAVLESPLLLLDRGVAFARSGDTLWAWDADGGVAAYRDGAWRNLPPLPGNVLDVAGALDESVWALTTESTNPVRSTLWYFEEGTWRQFPEEQPVPDPERFEDAETVEVDGVTGNVWLHYGEGLQRWDGVEWTSSGNPPIEMVLDDIVMIADGTVWAARYNPWFPELAAGLVRYHPDTGTWESVRPLGGDKDVPAVLAPTPNGNLWVLVADVPEWPRDDPTDWTPPSAWVLAYFDSTTGEWTLYRVPDGDPRDIVADDEAVWLTHRPAASEESMVARFDRMTWTNYVLGRTIDSLGIGADGTLWASIHPINRLRQLVTEGEASP